MGLSLGTELIGQIHSYWQRALRGLQVGCVYRLGLIKDRLSLFHGVELDLVVDRGGSC